VFNEEAHLESVIQATRTYARDILVVDDGSTDATPERLAAFPDVAVLRHEVNMGYGRSIVDAFTYADREGYDWLITMDCDEQHEPSAIPRFVEAMERDNADVISGSRYLRAFTDNDSPPADRQSINRTITAMLNRRLDLNITDAFCGFKAYRVSSAARMCIRENGYAMPMQFWAQAAWLKLRVIELPVKLVYNDPNRHFGGDLDNPTVRYRHYMDVFNAQMDALPAAVTSGDETPFRGRRCVQGDAKAAKCASS
jgi:dolichol-phosphate mannosyltransferase